MAEKYSDTIYDQLNVDINDAVGNSSDTSLDTTEDNFYKILKTSLNDFTTLDFDNDGFLKKLTDMDFENKQDKNMLRSLLKDVKSNHADINMINSVDLLLRRDIFNICDQMPEMRDVVYITRDAIVECDVVTGQIARTVNFENNQSDTNNVAVETLEKDYNLMNAVKNFIVTQTLTIGEMYINVVPYSRLFAELDMKNKRGISRSSSQYSMIESGNTYLTEVPSLKTDENVKLIFESVSSEVKTMATEGSKSTEKDLTDMEKDRIVKNDINTMLDNINVYPAGTPVLMQELGYDGMVEYLADEWDKQNPQRSFFESNIFGTDKHWNDQEPDEKEFKEIKGCYVKYLDSLNVLPVRLDRKIIGYYYVTKQVNNQVNAAQPNGVVDISFQAYTQDKKLVDSLASVIVKSFNKEMLNKNIQLKTEIAEIIMAHKFSEGRLSFLFIPENEIVRFAVNEDENGKGHSMIEPALFPARLYVLLTMYNTLFILNNNTIRIHYLKSSGLNKDYASSIQRTMRKFQSRRITIDDIYSYSGVLNKVGGNAEMVLPSGRGDDKAITTDTIEAANRPIELEFLDMQRRQAISATGVPALMILNTIDEVDFAKVAEMANTRFLSAVSSYKIDFNVQITKFYQKLLSYTSDLDQDEIASFKYKFNSINQPALNITNGMISDFNTLYELISGMYFSKDELEDQDGKPSAISIELKKQLVKEYLPQLDISKLDEMIDKVLLNANKKILDKQSSAENIDNEDLSKIDNKAEEQ